MNATFSSLALPGYRRYFTGALTSNTGTWVGRTAVSWLVLGGAAAVLVVLARRYGEPRPIDPAVGDALTGSGTWKPAHGAGKEGSA